MLQSHSAQDTLFPVLGKPFIKWAGGKRQLLNSIEKHLPQNFSQWKDAIYIEPFVGGGAVLFYLLNNYPNIKHAIINDINPCLVNLYRTIRNNVEELIKVLEQTEGSYLSLETEEKRKEYYLWQRNSFNSRELSFIEEAACFIFLNRTCFNGLFRVNSKGAFNVPFGRYANPLICDKETLRTDHKLLQRVTILQGDFNQTLNYIGNNTFVYLDPPYRPISLTASFTNYSNASFDDTEQVRLKDFCNTLSAKGCAIMQSNSDPKNLNINDNFFEELYASYNLHRVYASRAINSIGQKRG